VILESVRYLYRVTGVNDGSKLQKSLPAAGAVCRGEARKVLEKDFE
jgi:hypothetical protein